MMDVRIPNHLPLIFPSVEAQQYNSGKLSERNIETRINASSMQLMILKAEFEKCKDEDWANDYEAAVLAIEQSVQNILEKIPKPQEDSTPSIQQIRDVEKAYGLLLSRIDSLISFYRRESVSVEQRSTERVTEIGSKTEEMESIEQELSALFKQIDHHLPLIQKRFERLYVDKKDALNHPLPTDPNILENVAVRHHPVAPPEFLRRQFTTSIAIEATALKNFQVLNQAWSELSLTSLRTAIRSEILAKISPISHNIGVALTAAHAVIQQTNAFKISFLGTLAEPLNYVVKSDVWQSALFEKETGRLVAWNETIEALNTLVEQVTGNQEEMSDLHDDVIAAVQSLSDLLENLSKAKSSEIKKIESFRDDKVFSVEDKAQQKETISRFEMLQKELSTLLTEIRMEMITTWETLALHNRIASELATFMLDNLRLGHAMATLRMNLNQMHEKLRIEVKKGPGNLNAHVQRLKSQDAEISSLKEGFIAIMSEYEKGSKALDEKYKELARYFSATPAAKTLLRKSYLSDGMTLFEEEHKNSSFYERFDSEYLKYQGLISDAKKALEGASVSLQETYGIVIYEEGRIREAHQQYEGQNPENFAALYGAEAMRNLRHGASAVAGTFRSVFSLLPSLPSFGGAASQELVLPPPDNGKNKGGSEAPSNASNVGSGGSGPGAVGATAGAPPANAGALAGNAGVHAAGE